MKLNKLTSTVVLAATLLISSQAMAEFDITRMTTVVDDLYPSYTVTKSGRLEDSQFTGTSLTEFNQFHPGQGDNEASISGVISKQTSRGDGKINTTSSGNFELESINGSWNVSFTDLSILASEIGVELTGSVMVNDETYDAAELPEGVARMLRRVFWLTRR